MTTPVYPFQATQDELAISVERYIDQFIDSLQSFFMIMPRGSGYVSLARFERAYQTVLHETHGFQTLSRQIAVEAVRKDSLVLQVLRAILGLSPPELAHLATVSTAVDISQSTARRLDKRAREGGDLFSRTSNRTKQQVEAMIGVAVDLIVEGAPALRQDLLHRLDKIDTRGGIESVRSLAASGVSYATLLYERSIGRPFATHRDAVSERVGDILEDALRQRFHARDLPFYEAAVAERFEDMDQAPDFLLPNQFDPSVVIEAKLAEDDGTARDKVTRIQHLAELRDRHSRRGEPAYELIAFVDGRGFGIRREDVRKLITATKGKLFTLETVDQIVDHTSIRDIHRCGIIYLTGGHSYDRLAS